VNELIVIEQVLDIAVLACAQRAHVNNGRVHVLDVEEVLSVRVVALRARLARVHVRVEAEERVLDVGNARIKAALLALLTFVRRLGA
jgi:hypothetical protein